MTGRTLDDLFVSCRRRNNRKKNNNNKQDKTLPPAPRLPSKPVAFSFFFLMTQTATALNNGDENINNSAPAGQTVFDPKLNLVI